MMLYIRNMECDRCKTIVKTELDKLGLLCKSIELGEVEIVENISREKLQLIDIVLRNVGLELMENKKGRIVEKIKEVIYELIYESDNIARPNFSEYISKKVNRDYTYLSTLFSSVQSITIEKYIIAQRMDRVKELLMYDEMSLSHIAFIMKYSSVAHLSNTFKKVTGLTPSFYKQLRNGSHRKSKNM